MGRIIALVSITHPKAAQIAEIPTGVSGFLKRSKTGMVIGSTRRLADATGGLPFLR